MATCVECKNYYRRNRDNPTDCCEKCLDEMYDGTFDSESDVDINQLLNPTGKTPARFSDD